MEYDITSGHQRFHGRTVLEVSLHDSHIVRTFSPVFPALPHCTYNMVTGQSQLLYYIRSQHSVRPGYKYCFSIFCHCFSFFITDSGKFY